MRYISATETKQNLANIIDIARREPITIQRNGRSVVVMMAIEDYEKLSKQIVRHFQEFCDSVGKEAESKGMTEEKLNELLND